MSSRVSSRCLGVLTSTRTTRRLVFVVTLLLAFAATAGAQPVRRGLFREVAFDPTASRPATVRVAEAAIDVMVDLSAIRPDQSSDSAEMVELDLSLLRDAAGAPFVAVRDSAEVLPSGALAWTGHLAGVDLSGVTLVIDNAAGTLTGSIAAPDIGNFRIEPSPDGQGQLHTISKLDPLLLGPDDPAEPMQRPSDDPSTLEAPSDMQSDDGTRIDLLVVYTPAARAAQGGTTAIQNLIYAAVAEGNQTWANSGVTPRIRLVGMSEVSFSEYYSSSTNLNLLQGTADGYMDGVHALRNSTRADVVSLIVEGGDACGRGYLLYPTLSDASYAFNIVARVCAVGNYTFVHEIGHNMGARHDWFVDPTDNSPYTYNHGYYYGTSWRTVMSYVDACSPCPRVPYFSNPNLTYNGVALGRAEGLFQAADNRKALNNMSWYVANFRQEATPMTGVTITPNVAAPKSPGALITFTAAGSGGVAPYEYKFLLTTNNWASYSVVRDWSTTSTFSWTAGPAANYQMGVWARSSGNATDGAEVAAAISFPIVSLPTMTGVSISADKVSPQNPNTVIMFTASGAGGVAPYSYKFFVTSDNWVTWTVISNWSTQNTAIWSPLASGYYQVGVWARSSGNNADAPEQSAGMPFSVNFYLSVNVTGSGWVSTNDGGSITCPIFCSKAYPPGASLTFSTTPAANYVFSGSSGSSSPGCATRTVVMNGARTCHFEFLPASVSGTRRGTVNLDGSRFGDVFAYDEQTGNWTMENGEASSYFNEIKGTWSAGWSVYPADFNNDLLTDFFLYNAQNGQWYKVINGGNGSFTYFFGQWSPGWQIFIVDLNGDHRSDVFLHNPASGEWYWSVSTGNGTGGFAYTLGQWSAGWQVYPADLNADGYSDLFLYNSTLGWWYQVINDQAGAFQYTFGTWSAGWSVTPADFTGDGRTDFFLTSAATGQWYVAITGNLAFTYGGGTWSLGWTFSPGDFDGDGKADLLLHNPSNGWFYQAVSNGAGGFSLTFGSWAVGLRPYVSDFTDDGKSDVLLYNPTSGAALKAVNNGLGAFITGSHTWEKGLSTIIVGTSYP